jgi:hypothetical protein
MSDTAGFALFVLALAARAGRLADAYNHAVREYRHVNGVRSTSHPVSDLGVEGGRVELPFWAWAPEGPRRRLWVEAGRGATFLMDDEAFWTVDERTWRGMLREDAGAYDEAARRMLAGGRGNFRIRPRALSNTIFCRLFLSDVFIHGVGGAKYEGVTDDLVREFFVVEPPGFITCSATLFLPIDVEASRRDDLRRLRRDLRDARYNPERHMDDETRRSGRVEDLVGGKRRLIERNAELREQCALDGGPQVHRERREIFTDIRRRNAELATLIEGGIDSLTREIDRVARHVGDREAVQQRDYSFVLYPEKQLLDFYDEKLDLTRTTT